MAKKQKKSARKVKKDDGPSREDVEAIISALLAEVDAVLSQDEEPEPVKRKRERKSGRA